MTKIWYPPDFHVIYVLRNQNKVDNCIWLHFQGKIPVQQSIHMGSNHAFGGDTEFRKYVIHNVVQFMFLKPFTY